MNDGEASANSDNEGVMATAVHYGCHECAKSGQYTQIN
jgi:hypothetical protein